VPPHWPRGRLIGDGLEELLVRSRQHSDVAAAGAAAAAAAAAAAGAAPRGGGFVSSMEWPFDRGCHQAHAGMGEAGMPCGLEHMYYSVHLLQRRVSYIRLGAACICTQGAACLRCMTSFLVVQTMLCSTTVTAILGTHRWRCALVRCDLPLLACNLTKDTNTASREIHQHCYATMEHTLHESANPRQSFRAPTLRRVEAPGIRRISYSGHCLIAAKLQQDPRDKMQKYNK